MGIYPCLRAFNRAEANNSVIPCSPRNKPEEALFTEVYSMSALIPTRRLLLALALMPIVASAQSAPAGGPPQSPVAEAPHGGPGMPPMHGGEQRGNGPHGGDQFGMPLPPELHGVALTDAQQDKVFQIMYKQAPALREAMKKERHAHDDLQALILAPNFDESRARSLADSAGKAHGEMALLHATAQSQIQALLTPAQRQQIEEGGHRSPPPGRPEGPRS